MDEVVRKFLRARERLAGWGQMAGRCRKVSAREWASVRRLLEIVSVYAGPMVVHSITFAQFRIYVPVVIPVLFPCMRPLYADPTTVLI